MIKDFQIKQFIDKDNVFTKFLNNTLYDCYIQLKPIKPKRKYTDAIYIKKDHYHIIENTPFALFDIVITFKEPNV